MNLTADERRRLAYIKHNELERRSLSETIPLSQIVTTKGTRTHAEDDPVRRAFLRIEQTVDDVNDAINGAVARIDGNETPDDIDLLLIDGAVFRHADAIFQGVVLGSFFGVIIGLLASILF